jgi:hypothetical protein
MMCSIYIDESAIHMFIDARPSCLYIPLSEELNRLLDHLDNRHMMHDFQYDTLEWEHGN